MSCILTRTPFRIPLGGGGTDLPAFYKKHGGFLWSGAINKYIYVMKNNDDITSVSDFGYGTGMGRSAAFQVGMLKACNPDLSPERLAECTFEVGRQDQYLAAFGGITSLKISQDGKVDVERIQIDIEKLASSLLLFQTNKTHISQEILTDQQKRITSGEAEEAMKRIEQIGEELLFRARHLEFEQFGELLNEHWTLKKSTSPLVTDPELDTLYDKAISLGSTGGKLIGAGGGGCFVFWVPEKQEEFISKMPLKHIPYTFVDRGSEVLIKT